MGRSVACLVWIVLLSPLQVMHAEETVQRDEAAVGKELAEVKQVLEKLSSQVASLERELKGPQPAEQTPPQGRIFPMTYRVADLMRHVHGDFAVARDYDHLVGYIKAYIAPQQWQGAGGQGAIGVYDQNLSLVVSQTEEVHAELSNWLMRLREAKRLVTAFELGQSPKEEPEPVAQIGFGPAR